jgi:hypothetical protein
MRLVGPYSLSGWRDLEKRKVSCNSGNRKTIHGTSIPLPCYYTTKTIYFHSLFFPPSVPSLFPVPFLSNRSTNNQPKAKSGDAGSFLILNRFFARNSNNRNVRSVPKNFNCGNAWAEKFGVLADGSDVFVLKIAPAGEENSIW